jgi:nicotinamidase-related amidase
MSAASNPPAIGALLLCIDLQPVFLRAIADGPRVQQRCAFAVSAARGFGLPIAFTEQVPQKLGGTAPEILALAPKSPVWAKGTFSALADDGIRDALRARDADHLLICGLETSVCVYQTALDAIDEQYQVTVLSDCVAARRPDDAQTALAALVQAGVHVLPAETVFYALLRDAKHPFFKAFTDLVKNHG